MEKLMKTAERLRKKQGMINRLAAGEESRLRDSILWQMIKLYSRFLELRAQRFGTEIKPPPMTDEQILNMLSGKKQRKDFY